MDLIRLQRRVAVILILIFTFMPFNTTQSIARSEIEPTGYVHTGLRLLTFNAWFPPVWLPSLDKPGRFVRLADSLLDLHPDIICLQEVFDPEIRVGLLTDLKGTYSSLADTASKPFWWIFRKDKQGGLMTLSRLPIVSELFIPFPSDDNSTYDEQIAGKGILITRIRYGESLLIICNTHLCAGRGERDGRIRLAQMEFLKAVLDSCCVSGCNSLFLMGDLNLARPALPGDHYPLDDSSYRILTDDLGLIDSISDSVDRFLTYDTLANPYARLWYNRSEGRQKLDYILFRSADVWRVGRVRRVFDGTQPLSDHFGLSIEIERR